MAKLYVFLAEGFEEIEALGTVDILRRAGAEVITVGVTGRSVSGAHGIAVQADKLPEELTDDFDGIVLPGGMPGTLNLEKSGAVQSFIKKADEEKKWICAICAAPSILGHGGYLQGRNAVCYPGMEKELLGARVPDATVCVDGNIITSRGPATVFDFALTITERVCSAEKSASVGKGMLYLG